MAFGRVTWSPGIWESLVTRKVMTSSAPAVGSLGLRVRVAVSLRLVTATSSHDTSSAARKPNETRYSSHVPTSRAAR